MTIMKKTMLVAMCFSLFFVSFSQNRKDIKQSKIKTMTEYHYDYKTGHEVKELDEILKFDENGNLIEHKQYDAGKFLEHFKYEYNDHNNCIKEIEFTEKGDVKQTTTYKYVGDVMVEKIDYYPNGKMKKKKEYKLEFYED